MQKIKVKIMMIIIAVIVVVIAAVAFFFLRGGEMSTDQTDKVLDWLTKLGFTE